MASLLRISEAAALALHAMGHLAADEDGVMSARSLSRECGASDAHMMKVCQRLSRRGLLTSRRGLGGGFRLAKSAASIRLLDVYVAIEGPVKLRPCLFRDHSCRGHAGRPCVLGRKVRELEARFLRYLKETTLASVARSCSRKAAA